MVELKLKKLQVTNFRNLSTEPIVFGPKINCILGKNGNGKTNILEAIYVLINKKSFRKNTGFPQYLGLDGEEPEIIFSSLFNNTDNSLDISFSAKFESGTSQYFENGRPTKKKIPISTIFINPFDANAFHSSASFRRNFFDKLLADLSGEYSKTLKRFNSFLKMRNSLLSKKPPEYLKQIKAIDLQKVPCELNLTQLRLSLLKELRPFCSDIFQKIFHEDHTLDILLKPSIEFSSQELLADYYLNALPKDQILGYTRCGAHRDDYTLMFDGLNSYDYCSLGQQKMSYLSLLFAYIELFRYKFNTFPIVLIDDVSGELDKIRWNKFIKYLEGSSFQVFITTANENFKQELKKIESATQLEVISGSVF